MENPLYYTFSNPGIIAISSHCKFGNLSSKALSTSVENDFTNLIFFRSDGSFIHKTFFHF